jgi:hypothetical protein
MSTPPHRPPHLIDDGYYVEPEPVELPSHRPAPLGCVHVALGICIGVWLAALVLVGSSIVDATPSSSPESTLPVDLSGQRSTPATSGAPHSPGPAVVRGSPAAGTDGTPQPRSEAPIPSPSGDIGTALYSASATWCAPTPTQCQSWGGDAKLGAVFGFRFGDEPYRVRVSRGDRSVDVLVVSHCACGGTHNAIDLSPAAFRVLAPLSRGRVEVAVEDLRGMPGVTLPPTDTR